MTHGVNEGPNDQRAGAIPDATLMRASFEASAHYNVMLGLDGTVLEVNQTLLQALKAEKLDVVGRKVWDVVSLAGTPDLRQQLREAVPRAARGEVIENELFVDVPVGQLMFEFSMRPAWDKQHRIFAISAEAVELTAFHAAEEKQRQVLKMEAIGQLTGGLAHDFNNLLTGITGSLELVKARIAQGRVQEAERFINAAMTSASRAAALTHRLLAFSRRLTLDPKPVQANVLIAGMEELVRRTVGPKIMLHTELKDGLWMISCDPVQLENAVMNLCLNARDALPDGGMLTVQTDNVVLDPAQARARDMEPGPYVGIFVSDNGIGMSPEIASRAFDPFFTTKPIGLGTGLGLSMIYGFTQQSGGQVRIHSEPGHGTTMRMFLPRFAAGDGVLPDASITSTAINRMDMTQGQVVLVVDDEPAVRMLICEVMEELGLRVLQAADGNAGLAILRGHERVDLLISDVGLPGGLNGRQMADAARQVRPELKVMFITGYAETAVVGNGSLEAGMEVMTKPFSLDVLASRIQGMLEG